MAAPRNQATKHNPVAVRKQKCQLQTPHRQARSSLASNCTKKLKKPQSPKASCLRQTCSDQSQTIGGLRELRCPTAPPKTDMMHSLSINPKSFCSKLVPQAWPQQPRLKRSPNPFLMLGPAPRVHHLLPLKFGFLPDLKPKAQGRNCQRASQGCDRKRSRHGLREIVKPGESPIGSTQNSADAYCRMRRGRLACK